jgi:carboxyl-terminal processing protease
VGLAQPVDAKGPKTYVYIVRQNLFFLCLALWLPLYGADDAATKSATTTKELIPQEVAAGASLTKRFHLEPGPNDGQIAFTATRMLEQYHYLHLPFDADLSSKALDLYLNTYDPQHIHFLQEDLDEFERYRKHLGELTMQKQDTLPAYVIFNRYIERLEQKTDFARELLRTENFEFNGNERISLNRKTTPFPKDLAAAQQLWRERVRFDYLEERLNRESPAALAALMASRHTPMQLALTGHDLHEDIVKFVEKRYNRILRNFHEWESDKVLETYLTAIARVYDPHSDYEDKETLENFSIQMSLSLFGIGAVLTSDDDGYCKIVSLQPGMPAAKTKKINPGDRIVAVAQGTNEAVDAVQMPLTKVVEMIRGPKGTEVRLTIIPADAADSSQRQVVSIIRDEIKLEDQQAKAKMIERPGDDGHMERLGVVELPSFYASFPLMGHSRAEIKSATVDVDRLLEKLKDEHVDGVILDLRHNGGGSLPEAIDLAGLFIRQGPIVQVRSSGPDGSVMVEEDPDPRVQYDGPLVVLTDKFSASASEIVAGALQDYGRALVVGGTTHGKGTVQSMSQLAPYLFMNGDFFPTNPLSLGALKYTTNKFYRVSGSSTQLKGVIPDITLPSTYDYMETEESTEDYPLQWDTIRSADYEKLNRVAPYLAELEKRSAARVEKSRDFGYVRDDIEIVKKAMAEKSVSLNEEERLKEVAVEDARRRAREAEFKTRKPMDEKIYDLTLKDGEVIMTNEPVILAGNNSSMDPTTSSFTDSDAHKVRTAYQTFTNSAGFSTTNGVASASAGDAASGVTPPAPPEEPSPEEKAPLEEAERVLMDYISLLHSGSSLTADQAVKP